jgi:hypothetical protein
MRNNSMTTTGRRHTRSVVAAAIAAVVTAMIGAGISQANAATPPAESIWTTSAAQKALAASSDKLSVELGTSFTATADGVVTGVRFWKAKSAAGTHVGSLWSANGTRLARVTFTGESASGWQQATFATPVTVTKGTSYVVSYLAPKGGYAYTSKFSGTSASASLAVPTTNVGRFVYGSGGFPTSTYRSTNYWVDVLFTASTPALIGPSASPSATATSTSPSATPTASPSATATATPTATASPTPTATASPSPSPSSTPTATATATPTPTSTPTAPATSGGTPGASNTGVPAGVTLKASGGLTVTTANTVIDGLDISGAVVVKAPGVVIKNSRIHGSGSGTGVQTSGSGTVTVYDSEIYGFENGIGFDGWTAIRVNIHSTTGDGVKLGSNVLLQDSWIHNLTPSSGAHADGGQVQYGVVNTVIRHNVIDLSTTSSANSALFIAPDLGNSTNGPLTVEGNYLDGGNFTAFCVDGNDGQYFIGNITFRDNTFGRSAQYGPVRVNVPVTWTNNTYADTGKAISL